MIRDASTRPARELFEMKLRGHGSKRNSFFKPIVEPIGVVSVTPFLGVLVFVPWTAQISGHSSRDDFYKMRLDELSVL